MGIVAEFSNSTNITKRTLAAQAEARQAARDTRTPAQRRQDGFDAFCGGLSIYDLYDPFEQMGWWSALDTQAEAETPGYAESMGR